MLTAHDVDQAIAALQYKPGWKLTTYHTPRQGHWLAITASIEDSYTPGQHVDLRIKSAIPPMRDHAAVHEWIAWRLAVIEVHECHEWLRDRDGRPVFDPHADGADEPG